MKRRSYFLAQLSVFALFFARSRLATASPSARLTKDKAEWKRLLSPAIRLLR